MPGDVRSRLAVQALSAFFRAGLPSITSARTESRDARSEAEPSAGAIVAGGGSRRREAQRRDERARVSVRVPPCFPPRKSL
jgi:hypothetical protein